MSATPNRSGRAWARGGFTFGAASSLGLNLQDAWLHVADHAPYGKQATAVMWPLLLIATVEVMARVSWPTVNGWRTWGWPLARFGGFGTIGVTSAVISYTHVHAVLTYWGYSDISARSGAVCLDGLMVLCGFAMLAAAKAPAATQTGVSTLPGDATEPGATTKIAPGSVPDSAEGAGSDPGTAGRERAASHGQSSPSPAHKLVPALAPPGAGTSDPGRVGAVLPGRASDLDHVDQGHDPVDHTAVDHRDPDHVDQDQEGHPGPAGEPVVQGQRSTAEGHGPVHAVDLTQLSEDQAVQRYAARDLPGVTLDHLAGRLGVSRSTAKRRVGEVRDATGTKALRVVR